MREQILEDAFAFSQSLTKRIGETLSQQFGKVQAQHKPDGSLVTDSDQWADEQIRSAIMAYSPRKPFISSLTGNGVG